MGEQRQVPVHNSEVYVLRQMPYQAPPPLSPPSPITPAEEEFCPERIAELSLSEPAIAAVCDERLQAEERLSGAVHVLTTEMTALQNITKIYSTDRVARDGFNRAVDAITRRQRPGSPLGKVVVIGVGKSGHIAKKLVATFNSLAIQAVFLHPTEALHGDLGQIGSNDTLLLITFSGKTPELFQLLPHLDKSLPLILLTSHTRPETCELMRHRPDTILLPAPIHESETKSFGVSAPTTSTTVALTVGDALAIVASRELHESSVASVFARNHPGGAIGAALGHRPRDDVLSLAVPLADVPVLDPSPSATGLDVLRAGYSSPSGWLRLLGGQVISPRRIKGMGSADLGRPLAELVSARLFVARGELIPVAAETTVRKAAEWIRGLGRPKEGCEYDEDLIVAIMRHGECIGFLEAGRLFQRTKESV